MISLSRILSISLFLVSLSVFVFAAEDPPKPAPALPPRPLYPALPPGYSLGADLNKLLEPTRVFLDTTKGTFDSLLTAGSGEITVGYPLGAPITTEFFQSAATVRPALRSLIDQTSAQAAAAKINLSAALALKRAGDPRFSAPGALLPLIADAKNKNSILQYLTEMLSAVNLADSRSQIMLQILGASGLLTEANIQAAAYRGVVTPSQIIQWRNSMHLTALIPMVGGQFSQAAAQLNRPRFVALPPPDATNPFPRNPLSPGFGDNPFNGTRFLTGPSFVPSTQVSPGINFTPVYVPTPFIQNSLPTFSIPATTPVLR